MPRDRSVYPWYNCHKLHSPAQHNNTSETLATPTVRCVLSSPTTRQLRVSLNCLDELAPKVVGTNMIGGSALPPDVGVGVDTEGSPR